jgi:phosphatidylserine/phosphatidylglycerophosphate/cardiolipin synthase-like enzyme
LAAVLREFGRDELAAVCRAHGLDAEAAARRELIARLLVSAGLDPSESIPPPPDHRLDGLPRPGQTERRAHARPAPELVWTGPERANATARDTAVVLRALFERAQRQVILAGYDFTRGSSLLEPLWIALRDRGVDVRLFVHIEQTDEALSDRVAYGNAAIHALMAKVWPFGEPFPRVFYDARALMPRPRFNMHAKCMVVDGECALVTSANFTLRAHEQNTECGVLLEDPAFAHHLARQWLGLIDAELVVESGA